MSLELRKLSIDDGMDIYEMLQELPADENGFVNPMAGKTFDEFKKWLERSLKSAEQIGIIDGWKVPQTTYWLYEDGIPVGYGKVRHFLTERLLEEGGNVGYSICPAARNRGLGKKLLAMLILESSKLGIDKLLATIRKNNGASIQVALANGGEIQKTTDERVYIWINSKEVW